MLMHNGRLANPLDPYTREIASIAKKRNKSDDDLAALMSIEARGACYETEDGLLGLPTANIWAAIYVAAKAFKLGEDIKRALTYEATEIAPLAIDGEVVAASEYLRWEGAIDYRSVVVQRRRTMRARPIIANWQSEHHMILDEEVVNLDRLTPVFARAGKYVGVCDWRPIYGRFALSIA